MDDEIIELLKLHEGYREKPYLDTMDKLTIGIGHNLTDNGLSETLIHLLVREDIEIARDDLDEIYPDWVGLSRSRQLVLIDMAFNLGKPRYLTFKRFWKALKAGDYDLAAKEMLDSKWSKQVGDRADRLYNMMVEG